MFEVLRFEYGFLGIPRHMVSTPAAAEHLVFEEWSNSWLRSADQLLDFAVLPTRHLTSHAERKGWAWRTDQVTDGMLFQDAEVNIWKDELAAYGYVGESTPGIAAQKPVLRPVEIAATDEGVIAVTGAPGSFTGAPILAMTPRSDGNLGFFVLGMVGSNPRLAADDIRGPRPLIPAPVIKSAVAEIYRRATSAE